MAGVYKDGPPIKNVLAAVGPIVIFAFASWATYGTHLEDADRLYGGGTRVVDFGPTNKERNERGLETLLNLGERERMAVYERETDGRLPPPSQG